MRLSILFSVRRPAATPPPVFNHRPRLRDLHRFGLMSVYRRPSLFSLWEPLRGEPASERDLQG